MGEELRTILEKMRLFLDRIIFLLISIAKIYQIVRGISLSLLEAIFLYFGHY